MFHYVSVCKCWFTMHVNIQAELLCVISFILFYYVENCPSYSIFFFNGEIQNAISLVTKQYVPEFSDKRHRLCNYWV
jgi:hypothetical protein